MKGKSIFYSIFRVVVGVGILFFLGMLYWSSVETEKEVKTLRSEVRNLKMTAARRAPATSRQLDEKYPNLLNENVFRKETLPSLLPIDFEPRGLQRAGEMGKPHHFHPFAGWAPVSAAWAHCVPSLATMEFGKFETLAPELAVKIEERSPGEFWIHLREGVEWAPLEQRFFPPSVKLAPEFLKPHPVTAQDFVFYYDALMNPHVSESGATALRTYLRDIEEVRAVDDLTLVVRWKLDDGKAKYTAKQLTGSLRPLPRWLYQRFADGTKIIEGEDYQANSVWAQNFVQHWANQIIPSCGPWLFDGLTDREIRFRRNPDHYDPLAALSEGVVIDYKESGDTLWQDFKGGKLDTFESRYAPEKILELSDFKKSELYKRQPAIERIDYLDRSYRYIGWNQKRPFFEKPELRRAMTMAIDRQRIIDQILGGLAVETTGSFFPNSSAYDASIEPLPYDPVAAVRILEAEGWVDSDGDGIREKVIDGKVVKFSFGLTYYVKSTVSRTTVDFIATALRDIGIDCRPMGVEAADLAHAFENKDFDALYLAWGLGTPPEDPRQIWHSSGADQKGSSNSVGFANPEADAVIEALTYESDLAKREELYHRFHAILHEEAPYTFLYVPKMAFLYRDYMQNVFIPAERQDLIPGADVTSPSSDIFWMKS